MSHSVWQEEHTAVGAIDRHVRAGACLPARHWNSQFAKPGCRAKQDLMAGNVRANSRTGSFDEGAKLPRRCVQPIGDANRMWMNRVNGGRVNPASFLLA